MRPPVPRDPQLYHGVGDKKMDGKAWAMAQTSNKYLSEPLLWRDKMRKKFRLVTKPHIERLKQARAA